MFQHHCIVSHRFAGLTSNPWGGEAPPLALPHIHLLFFAPLQHPLPIVVVRQLLDQLPSFTQPHRHGDTNLDLGAVCDLGIQLMSVTSLSGRSPAPFNIDIKEYVEEGISGVEGRLYSLRECSISQQKEKRDSQNSHDSGGKDPAEKIVVLECKSSY